MYICCCQADVECNIVHTEPPYQALIIKPLAKEKINMARNINFMDEAGLYVSFSVKVLLRLGAALINGFDLVVDIDPKKKADYYRARGLAHARAGRAIQAIPLLEHVLMQRPHDFEAGLQLGACMIKIGRLQEGIRLLEEANRGGAANPSAAKVLGLAYAQAGEHERALPLLATALTSFPESFILLYRMGMCLDHQCRPADAVNCFERALGHRPRATKVMRALGYALEKLGERDRALTYFKQADEIESGGASE